MPGHSDFENLGIFPFDPRFRPIAPPTTNIDDAPTIGICINTKWVGHIVGVLERLLWPDAWAGDDDTKQRAVAQITALLVQLGRRSPCGEIGDDCIGYSPNHPLVEWLPTNPFTDPDARPSGYLAAPFSVVNLEIEGVLGALADALGIDLAYLAGLQNGDVITTLVSIPNNPIEVLTDGLPRFIVRVNGIGTVNLELVNMPLGGLCAIGKDTYIDIPGLLGGVIGGGVTLVDLNRDFVSLPPETATIIGQEIEFTTGGAHFIEVAFLPIIDDSVTLIRFGGGLRSIELCGFEPVEGNNVIRQNPDDCTKLEQSSDGINWTVVADFDGCIVGEPGEDGAPGAPGTGGNEYPPPPTSAEPDALCNAAAFIVGKVRSLIYGVIADLGTVSPSEIFEGLLLGGGWRSSPLYALIGLLEAGDTSGLIAEYDAAADELQCELYAFELDKAVFSSWVAAHTAFSSIMRDAITHALDAASDSGQYALWAAVGATKTDADCDTCDDQEPCLTFTMPGTAGAGGFPSGYIVTEGLSYTITATGEIVYYPAGGAGSDTTGPEGKAPKPWGSGICPSAGVVELVAKIGSGGDLFPVGASLTFTASATGQVYTTINELSPDTYGDNSGSFEIEICLNE